MKQRLMHVLLALSVFWLFTATLHTHDADHDHDDCPTCLVKHLAPAALTPEPLKVCDPCFHAAQQLATHTRIVIESVDTLNAARAPPFVSFV